MKCTTLVVKGLLSLGAITIIGGILFAASPDVTTAVVVGTDDRVRITDTAKYPWRAIAWLSLYDQLDLFTGNCTGTFIGPNALLTAAHCLWEPGIGWTGAIAVVPGRDGDYEPFGYQFAEAWWVPDQWIETGGNPAYDWGVIKMPDSSMGNTVGWLTVASLTTETLSRSDFTPAIVGYPGDKPWGTMWDASANKFLAAASEDMMVYDIDTTTGQSGSAIFSANADEWFFRYVVGIHAYASTTDEVNFGIRVDAELLDDIKHGCEVMGCSIATFVESPAVAPTPPASPATGARFSAIAGDTGGGYWLPFAGDFDGDGDADYGVKGAEGRWYVMWNQGNGLMGDTWLVSGPSTRFSDISGDTGGGYWLPFIGDFDGDGDADYGVKGADGRWYVIWNQGNGLMGDAWFVSPDSPRFSGVSGDTGSGQWLPFAGDFDGDGDSDYGVKARDGRWYVVWNKGNGLMGDTWHVSGPAPRFSGISGDTGGGNWIPFSGDFDKDGDADYGVQSSDGRWYVIWNQGMGQMGDAWHVSGASSRFSSTSGDTGGGYWLPFAGDFDRDGDADYGVKGVDGRWYVLWNQGNGVMGDAWYVNN